MIFFKKQFFDLIRTGRKTTTLRYWSRPMVKADTVHLVPHLGKVHVKSVEIVRLADLTRVDAINDGFASLKELTLAMKEMYSPQQRKNRKLYLIKFKFLGSQQN